MKALFAFYECIFKSLKKHKTDTLLNISNVIINQIISVFFLYVIISNVPSLNGWNQDKLIFLYGIFLFNRGVACFFTESVYEIETQIKMGTFDGILVRPVSPILQILGLSLSFGDLVNVGVGLIIIFCKIHVFIRGNGLFEMVVIAVYAILSLVIVFSIRLISMSIAFWTLTSYPVAIAMDNFSEFARYPTSIYKKGIRFFLDYIIPFSVLAYFPAVAIIERKTSVIWGSVLIAIGVAIIAEVVWRLGIRNYKSSGH